MNVPDSLLWSVLAVAAAAAATWIWLMPMAQGRLEPRARTGSGLETFASWWRVRRAARHDSDQVAEVMALLAAELRAGVDPVRAAAHVAEDHHELEPWAAAVARGEPTGPVLTRLAQQPGWQRIGELDGAWQVALQSGAPLADVVTRVGADVRDDLELRREVARQVAPARSTGRLMAILPAFGLFLGAGMGPHPVAVITSSPIAFVSVSIGTSLAVTGWWWIGRIARSAEQA